MIVVACSRLIVIARLEPEPLGAFTYHAVFHTAIKLAAKQTTERKAFLVVNQAEKRERGGARGEEI
jgi:hypothetical protein